MCARLLKNFSDGYAKKNPMRDRVLCHRERDDKNRIIFMIYRYSAATFLVVILYCVQLKEFFFFGCIIFDPFSIVAVCTLSVLFVFGPCLLLLLLLLSSSCAFSVSFFFVRYFSVCIIIILYTLFFV